MSLTLNHDNDYAVEIPIAAPIEAVFVALTTLEGLTGWWVRATGNAEAGGEITFDFGENATVMRVDEATRSAVRWTCISMNDPQFADWIGTTISFVLHDDGDTTRVAFTHAGLQPQIECWDQCSAGWNYYTKNLAAYVTGQTQAPRTDR